MVTITASWKCLFFFCF